MHRRPPGGGVGPPGAHRAGDSRRGFPSRYPGHAPHGLHRRQYSSLAGPGGHFARPCFHDANVPLASGGFEKLNVDLGGAKSLAEMKEPIAARARTAAEGEWLVGRGWAHTLWTGRTLPGRKDLDAVTGNHP